MAIPDEDVAAVRAATDLVAVAGERLALKRQGRRWVGLCPFHKEKTPSFSVNAEEGLYYCFGCQASGDAISFVRALDHLDFVGAVEALADRAGITLHKDDSASGADRQRRRALGEAVDSAVAWYHERLLSHPDAARARDYLRSRGYDGQLVREFKLGWAPDEWDALSSSLRLPDRVLRDSGLGIVNRAGRQQDAMRARVIFPIFDAGGKAVALGGRVLPGSAPGGRGATGPKYKNSSETPLYSKRRTLYGLNWAKADVVDTGEAIVCEGYTDVIAFFRAGVRRAVATCGTALAEEHFQLLKRFAKRVVLAYDADAAGEAAAQRLYDWERRHDLDIAVAELPAGSDPAELGQTDPEALVAAVEGAMPFLDVRVRQVMGSYNLSTAEGRARAAEAAMAPIAEHPSSLVRDQYVMTVSDRTRVPPERLRGLLQRQMRARRGATGPRRAGEGRGAAPGNGRVESASDPQPVWRHEMANPGAEALRLAIHRPEEVATLLDEALFTEGVQRAAFVALANSTTLHEAIGATTPEVGSMLRRLAVEETDADPNDVVTRLAATAGQVALSELEAESRASEGRFEELAPVTRWLRLNLEELRESEPDLEAVERLVAWLSSREPARPAAPSEEGA